MQWFGFFFSVFGKFNIQFKEYNEGHSGPSVWFVFSGNKRTSWWPNTLKSLFSTWFQLITLTESCTKNWALWVQDNSSPKLHQLIDRISRYATYDIHPANHTIETGSTLFEQYNLQLLSCGEHKMQMLIVDKEFWKSINRSGIEKKNIPQIY